MQFEAIAVEHGGPENANCSPQRTESSVSLMVEQMTEDDRKRANARSYFNVYVRRGKILREPCAGCGTTENVEGHHFKGYDFPLDVIWLCRTHHRATHDLLAEQRRSETLTRMLAHIGAS